MKTLKLDDTNYGTTLTRTELPVLLFFRSSFCGPSAAMDPLLDRLYDDYEDIYLADIDVEDCPKITRELQVKGTPTLIIYNLGTALASMIGTMEYADLSGWLEGHIPRG